MAHAGGRPPLYSSEKQMCDFIEDHIKDFCTNALGCNLLSYKRESFMQPKLKSGAIQVENQYAIS